MIFQEKGWIWETELPTGVNNIFNGRTLVYRQTFATIIISKLKSFRNEIFFWTVGHSVLGITLNNNSHLFTAEISNIPPNKYSPLFTNPPTIRLQTNLPSPLLWKPPFSIFNRLLVTGETKSIPNRILEKSHHLKSITISRKSWFRKEWASLSRRSKNTCLKNFTKKKSCYL